MCIEIKSGGKKCNHKCLKTCSLNNRPVRNQVKTNPSNRSDQQSNQLRGRNYPLAATLALVALMAVFGSAGQVNASGLLVADGGFGGVLEIKEQDVRITINNGIAVTEVNQVFLNTENRIVEALYTFPVPKGASVSNFSMIIGGKEMIGEVVEKKRARQIYESYKSTRVDPGLLEQVDYKTFEMRVFPIAANAEQHIKVTYYQQLDFDHDWATYVYPLATSTKGVDDRTTGKFALTVDINSEIPIKALTSPSHQNDFVMANHTPKYARASLETTAGDLSRDVVIAFQTKRPSTGLDLIASKQGNEDGYFLMTLTSGEELDKEASGSMDYVFLLDISGSMANKGKLGLSTNAAAAFIDSLGPEDRCEVMSFNNLPNFHFKELRPVTAETKTDARSFIADLKSKGGTELHPALTSAFKYKDPDRALNVVILSDGMTNRTEQQELLSAAETAQAGTRVFCIGVGNDVNKPLLNQVAEQAGGLAAFISQGDDFKRQAEAFRRKLVHPVATELSIEIDGVPVYDALPGKLPNLFHGSPIRMIGRYKNSGKAVVTVKGNVMGRPFEQQVEMEFPAVDKDNPQIERMWAYSNVQKLMNDIRKKGESQELKDEIVRLCEGYSIVSEYASFIVLENDREFKRWKIERRNATRIQRDREAREKVAEELKKLRDKAMAKLGPNSESQNRKVVSNSKSNKESRPQVSNRQWESASPISTRNQDISFTSGDSVNNSSGGSGGGGGAIDPVSAAIGLGLAGSALRRRRNSVKQQEAEN